MADGDNNISWDMIPMDVLVDVLQRLPMSSRRRSRLVCRLWRDAVNTRTDEMRSRPKTLIASFDTVHIVEDSPCGSAELLTGETYDGLSFVGTCNGLICLCDIKKPGCPVTLSNRLTGETLAIPPLPLPYEKSPSNFTMTFAYHPTTGRYKVVHVPYSLDRIWVFTLGETSWRDVSTGSPMEIFDSGDIFSVDGVVYWEVRGTEAKLKVMSFDLDGEHTASVGPLPNVSSAGWHLMEAHGRLGVAFIQECWTSYRTEVWVMEQGQRSRWSLWYIVHTPRQRNWSMHQEHQLTQPMFTSHDGKHVLTMVYNGESYVLYKHKLTTSGEKTRRGVVEIDGRNQGTVVGDIHTKYFWRRTFAYVDTTEPLSVYRCW